MIVSSSRLIAQEALAEFICDASKSFKEAYWFAIRGESSFSVCMHTLLTMDGYRELLYHAGLLSAEGKGYKYSEEIIWHRLYSQRTDNNKRTIQQSIGLDKIREKVYFDRLHQRPTAAIGCPATNTSSWDDQCIADSIHNTQQF